MRIERFKKLKDNRYEIYLDNYEKLILYDDVIVKYALLGQKDFTYSFILKIKKENDELSSYYQAIKYINIKLRSEGEIRGFLLKKEYPLNTIDKTIKRLRDNNFLNNKVYLTSYINDALNLTNNGYYKILNNLEKLGFAEEEILLYLPSIESPIWENKLKHLITKKIKLSHQYRGMRLFNKICYDLIYLGYAKEKIVEILEKYELNDNNDLEKEFLKLKAKLAKKYSGKELNLYLKKKLLQKGFSYDEVNDLLN